MATPVSWRLPSERQPPLELSGNESLSPADLKLETYSQDAVESLLSCASPQTRSGTVPLLDVY